MGLPVYVQLLLVAASVVGNLSSLVIGIYLRVAIRRRHAKYEGIEEQVRHHREIFIKLGHIQVTPVEVARARDVGYIGDQ